MGARAVHAFVFVFAVQAAAFPTPWTELQIPQAAFDTLSNATAPILSRTVLATNLVLPKLRIFFNNSAHAIEVQPSEVTVDKQFPDQTVDTSCDHTITAEHPKAMGTLLNSSYLMMGVSHVSWKSVQVFADAAVNAKLDIAADIKVEVGKHVFGHHCTHLGHKTVGVDVHSTGRNAIGLNFTASNPRIQKRVNASGWELAFEFHADVVGLVLSWNVDDVVVKNCKIEILGVKIGSYCGLLERMIKNGVNKLSSHVSRVEAPKISQKLQNVINTAIGSTVHIPIKL
jgi:hypothetical protein